jgi:hypothetical protein
VFNSTDLREFHFQRWLTNPEVREHVLDRMTQVLYRVLKGQNSAFNESTFPDSEPQENIRDLAARLEVLQRSVDDLRTQLGTAAPASEPPSPP